MSGFLRRFAPLFSGHTDEWVLAFIAVFLFFVATNTQTGWLFVVCALIGAVLVLGFLGPRATLKGLEVEADSPDPAYQGTRLRLPVRVRNPGRATRALFLVGTKGGPRSLVSRLEAGASARVEVETECPRRGVFPIPAVELSSATPFGLFAHRRVLQPPGELVVFPRGPRLDTRTSQASPGRGHQSRSFHRAGSSYDLRGLRPYQMGEDIRAIHWPSSARTGELMLREYHESGARGLALVLLNGSACGSGGEDSPLEQSVLLAASLVDYALREGVPLRLMAALNGELAERSAGRPEPYLDLLARVRPEPMEGADILSMAAERVERQGSVLILAASPTGAGEGWDALRQRRARARVLGLCPAGMQVPTGVPLLRPVPGQELARLLEAGLR